MSSTAGSAMIWRTGRSTTFETLYPGRQLPEFVWLKIKGKAGTDDFGIERMGRLVVSAKALTVLRSFNLNYCDVAPYQAADSRHFGHEGPCRGHLYTKWFRRIPRKMTGTEFFS
jgi:hypothetical protein